LWVLLVLASYCSEPQSPVTAYIRQSINVRLDRSDELARLYWDPRSLCSSSLGGLCSRRHARGTPRLLVRAVRDSPAHLRRSPLKPPTVIAGKPAWTVGISAAIVYGIVLPKVALGAWASGRRLAATRRDERSGGRDAREPVAGDGHKRTSFRKDTKSLRMVFFILLAAQTSWVIVSLISGHGPHEASLPLALSEVALLAAWWLLGRRTRRQPRSI
jgi:hypothetical protein